MKLLWLTDLHFDETTAMTREWFLEKLRLSEFDGVVITGDISAPESLCTDLMQIAEVCCPRMVYFVGGNHDYGQKARALINEELDAVSRTQKNLYRLDRTPKPVALSARTGLVGHPGAADWHFASGKCVPGPVGQASTSYLRNALPYALTCFERVIVCTHFPPFADAVFFDGKRCTGDRLRRFSNLPFGRTLTGISRCFGERRITVLCGHSHHSAVVQVAPQIEVRVGNVTPGCPDIQQVFSLS